ncbi:H-NS histone family protein [Burkholderia pseudomallei]|uniref:H-NS histone family protein n=4 Tax=Burkholderia pseudomallei TaxID=28450 RepID=UPI00016B051A|nr:H-NS histone family protein [Burkholderia pseudomallei]APY96263.1 DNA-binding protein [Burkholderia pseudomallei]ARK45945.1 DNA-binding protein [Burkholderia pseudomallei]ARK55913.1 DNA-binding protein [Burkholderia pseudomallei]ARK83456.1 DNA-binding protein [Burkholderia pseudomallei]ARL05246.1 DNA-binding protein [Burkholderia pseudomallei]
MATYEELKAQLDALNKEAEAAKAREISTALSQIRETVLRYEIRPDQIFPQWTRLRSPDKRRGPLPPKYRNPMTGETWCGRGRAPKWMSGSPREAFLIDRLA